MIQIGSAKKMELIKIKYNKIASTLFFQFLVLFLSINIIQCLKYEFVTWGSTFKLLNVNANVRLHSHDVKYGSGSGQQSVTAVKNADDHNSYWQLRPSTRASSTLAERGQPVKCGDTFRLFHLSTKRNLHSHLFQSPLSNNQEVSAFGELGAGDDGDNWQVVCDEDYWRRDEQIKLKHALTGKFLHVSGDTYGRPIHGQFEVSCYAYANQLNWWKVAEGVYVRPGQQQHAGNDYNHTEL